MSSEHTGDSSTSKGDRDCPVSRRAFLATTAAAAGGAAGVSTASASERTADRSVMSEEYEYVYERVAPGERIPTYVDVWEGFALGFVEEFGTDYHDIDGPQAAAYVKLTPEEVDELTENFLVTGLEFSPGANPFWRHIDYPDRVFPKTTEAVDYIAYEEAVAGLETLAERHTNRLSLSSIGESPGLEDDLADELERSPVWLAELTNDVGNAAKKEAVVCSIGIHGDERAGVEAGLRFIESVLNGEEPAVEAVLDDIVLVFVLSNPDGWISRIPRTVNAEDASTDAYMRLTGSRNDPNRQYPTVGSIDPSNYPAEPNGSNLIDDDDGIDDDVPPEYIENVPDALGIVNRLRKYDDVAFAADYHGLYGDQYLVKGLLMNDPYGVEGHAEMDAFNEALVDRMDDAVGDLLVENREAIEEAARARARRGGAPTSGYTYGTIYDTIGYAASGAIGFWLTNATEQGGLDAPALVFEMALDNSGFGVPLDYRPGLVEAQVAAYEASFRQLVESATTPVDARIDDNGRSLGYVDSPSVTRDSADLPFSDTDVWRASSDVQTTDSGHVDLDRPAHTVSITVRPASQGVDTATVEAPGISRTEAVGDGEFARGADWLLTDVDPGRVTINIDGEDGTAAVDVTVVHADDAPDPREVLGYEQRSYTVTPTAYFEEYGEAIEGGAVAAGSVSEVADGALLDGDEPAVDVLAVIHDDGLNNPDYVEAIDAYLDAGGELVCTDDGVVLLSALTAGGAAQISAGDVRSTRNRFPLLEQKGSHPLLDGVQDIEQELWTVPTLGYTIDDGAPMTLVDRSSFEGAGGAVAALANGDVVLGELDAITVIGSLLPPASQSNLHPFGLADYGLSAMGQRVFLNAVGHSQR